MERLTIRACGLLVFLSVSLHAPPVQAWCGDRPADEGVTTDPPEDPSPAIGACTGAEPVDLHSGAYTLEVTDLKIPGRGMDFEFTRHYNSHYNYDSRMGYNWNWNYHEYLMVDGNDVTYVTKDLREYTFQWDGQKYDSPTGIFATLEKNQDNTYTLKERSGMSRHFRTDGYMDTVEDAAGNQIGLLYDEASKKITSVIDTLGRVITIEYGMMGRISAVTDWANRTISFEYDWDQNLTKVTGPTTDEYPEGKIVEYTYSENTGITDLDHNLLTIKDAQGLVYLTNTYDTDDRIATQTYGSGTFTFVYDNSGPNRKTTVTDRVGNVTQYTFNQTGQALEEKRNTRGVRPGDPAAWTTQHQYNADGLRTKTIFPNGNVVEYTYDSANPDRHMQYNLTESRAKAADGPNGPDDLVTSYTYESSYNQVKTITDPDGLVTTNYYDYEEATLGDLNGDGVTDQDNGKLIKTTYPQVTSGQPQPQTIVRLFTYNNFGQLLTDKDPEGNVTKFEYYTEGSQKGYLQKTIADSGVGRLNLTTEFTYDQVGNPLTVKDPRGNTATYTVNPLNLITQKSETVTVNGSPATYTTTYAYDANNNVMSVTRTNLDGEGSPGAIPLTTSYMYDSLNHVTTVMETVDVYSSRMTQFEYDANENRTKVTLPNGNAVSYQFDERDLLYKEIRDPGGIAATTIFTYDGNRNLTKSTDPRGNHTTGSYDGFNRRTLATDPLGNKTSTSYDKNSNVVQVARHSSAQELLARTTYTYDELNRRWQESQWISATQEAVTTLLFDRNSRLTKVTDDNGHIRTRAHDGANRLVETQDHLGNTVAYTLDPNGNRTQVTSTEKHPGQADETFVQKNTFDELDRLVQTRDQGPDGIIDNADDGITIRAYDSRSNIDKVTDAESTITRYWLDGLSRVTSKMEDDGGLGVSTFYIYDLNSNLMQVMDANGGSTGSMYDNLDRRTQITYPDTKSVSLGYDAASNLVQVADQNGTAVANTFDTLNRITGQAITPGPAVLGTTARGYEYDGLSRLTKITDNNNPSDPDDDSEVTFTYDGSSRVVSTTQKLGTNSKTVSYTHDGVGNRLSTTYPDSSVVSSTNDALNRTAEIHRGATPTNPVATFTYAGFSRTVERKYFAGATSTPISTNTIAYDGIKRITQHHNQFQDTTAIARFDYGYDKAHNKLWEERLHDPTNSERYAYDKLYRLTEFKRGQLDAGKQIPNPSITKTWSLDNVHNWSSLTVGQLFETRMHDQVNQLNSRFGPHQPDVHTAALWHFEETTGSANDSSANGNDGTVAGAARQNPGQHGNAYSFDGIDDKVEVVDSDSLDVTGDLTVEAYVSAWGMGSQVICAKWGNAGQRSYQLRLQDDKLVGSLSSNGTNVTSVTSTTSIWGGYWTHVAMRLRGTELSLWINGMKETQTAVFNGPIHEGTAKLGIAWQADTATPGWYNGDLDEVRVSAFARAIFDNQTYTYDANGNLTSDGDLNYAYDFLNRLVKVTRVADNSVVAEYAYDGLGRRVLKRVHTSPTTTHETRFVYANHDVIAEYDGDDVLQAKYILGRRIDEPLVMERRDRADVDSDGNKTEFQTFYCQTNHLGTIAALTWWDDANAQEKLIERCQYDAYGFAKVTHWGADRTFGTADDRSQPTSLVGNAYGFTARRLDPETGLLHFRARSYSTSLGRFISRDPLGYVDGMNLYAAYFVPCGVDPFGNWVSWGDVLGVAGRARRALDAGARAVRSAGEAVYDFGTHGAGGFFEVVSPPWGLPAIPRPENDAQYYGRVAGRTVGAAVAAAEIVIGGTAAATGSGVTVSSLGTTSLVSVPLAVAGTGLASMGVAHARNAITLDPVPEPSYRVNNNSSLCKGQSPGTSSKATKSAKELPALDSTGKVHGELPKPQDLNKYCADELRQLRGELGKSVQERIRKTVELGSDKAHGQRLAAEQDLIKAIEKYLSGS